MKKNKIFSTYVAMFALVSVMGAGCNPFASLQQRVEQRIGEEIGEGLVEGMAGGQADLELGKLPADFPEDVPRYPDAEYVSAVHMQDRNISIANFTTKDEPQAVVDWFDRELKASGFAPDEDIAKLGLFRVYNKGAVKITIQTQRSEGSGETTVSVQRVVSGR